jgi:sigma-B regulation protein RsbU (phosphoserine phosphatase)
LKELTKELDNLVTKLSTLSELTELVSRIPDIKEGLEIILQRTMAAVSAKMGSIMILDDETQVLRIAAAEGLDESVISDTTVPLGEGVAGKVARTGEPALVEDYETSSFISMPLRAHLQILGVLNLSKKGNRGTFTDSF